MTPKRVLILCTGNSCRSQMAEGFLRHQSGGRVEVRSAGTRPSRVNPVAVRVMKEIGIDISAQRSKHVSEFADERFDYVITVCGDAEKTCPTFAGTTTRLYWPFPDPPHGAGEELPEALEQFRRVRDQIGERFGRFAEEI